MLSPSQLGYREHGSCWVKPVEIRDTVRSGDKVVAVNAFLLFVIRPPSTMGFYCHNGSLRARDYSVCTAEAVSRFERCCLGVKHWFYLLPQTKQFQDAVGAWVKGEQGLALTFSDLERSTR